MVQSYSKLEQLLVGELAKTTWQYQPYDRDSATWLAAAQRRHMHRRRGNVLTGVASIDLSGPHEPTPLIGHRIGQRSGHYYLVLSVRPDEGQGHKTRSTQTTTDEGGNDCDESSSQIQIEQVDEGEVRDSRSPLLYVEVISTKGEAAAAVMRLLARIRDDHGHLPSSIPHRLHSDKGQ